MLEKDFNKRRDRRGNKLACQNSFKRTVRRAHRRCLSNYRPMVRTAHPTWSSRPLV